MSSSLSASHYCSPEQKGWRVQSPQHWLCFGLGLSFKLWATCYAEPKPQSPGTWRSGKFPIRHLLWWLSFTSTVKSVSQLQCKGQHASSGGSPCIRLPQCTVSLSWSFDTLDHQQRRGKLLTTAHWQPLQSAISLDSWTSLQQGHRGPRQGTCLKSQRSLLEDSWTSSRTHGKPDQPLSQGLHGVGNVVLGI